MSRDYVGVYAQDRDMGESMNEVRLQGQSQRDEALCNPTASSHRIHPFPSLPSSLTLSNPLSAVK